MSKMEIPILQGVYADGKSLDIRYALPKNLYPVAKSTGAGEGYFRQSEGAILCLGELEAYNGSTSVILKKDVAVLVWKDRMYRLMLDENGGGWLVILKEGEKLLEKVQAIPIPHGVSEQNSRMDYSWDNLIISTNNHLYYYNADDGLREVTDQSVGDVKDAIFVDGYTMFTDGEFMVVTELNDPMAINPLKYGSSEADPDPIIQLHRVRGEVYALNRYTIEVFQNVGGDNYPFQRVDGALCMKGVYNHGASTTVGEQLVFVGSGKGEALGFYAYNNGIAQKLSTNDIDRWLDDHKNAPFHVESRVFSGHKFVYIHAQEQERTIVRDKYHDNIIEKVPAGTVVIDIAASEEMQRPVWIELTSQKPLDKEEDLSFFRVGTLDKVERHAPYMFYNFAEFAGKWIAAQREEYSSYTGAAFFVMNEDDPRIVTHEGILEHTFRMQYRDVWWEFSTPMIYLGGNGAIVNSLELIGIVGRAGEDEEYIFGYNEFEHSLLFLDRKVYTQYSKDGMTWSEPRFVEFDVPGFSRKRIVFFNNGMIRNWRIQRFFGNSNVRITINSLNADLEQLDA